MTISGATVGTAGDKFQLTCIMTVVDHLAADATRTIQWSVGLEDGVTESDTSPDGVNSTRRLTFNPLHTSHGAEYTCQAKISISSINVSKPGSERAEVMVRSK